MTSTSRPAGPSRPAITDAASRSSSTTPGFSQAARCDARHTPRHERAGGGGDPRRDPRPRADHVRRVHGARALRAGRLLRGPAGRDGRRLRDEPARPPGVRRAARRGRAGARSRAWRPEPLRIAEVGAGDGTLATQLLGALAGLDVDYEAIDASEGARSALAAIGGVRAEATLSSAAPLTSSSPTSSWTTCRSAVSAAIERSASAWTGERFVEVEVPWDGEPVPPAHETDRARSARSRSSIDLARRSRAGTRCSSTTAPSARRRRRPRLPRSPRRRGRAGRPRLGGHHRRRGLRAIAAPRRASAA